MKINDLFEITDDQFNLLDFAGHRLSVVEVEDVSGSISVDGLPAPIFYSDFFGEDNGGSMRGEYEDGTAVLAHSYITGKPKIQASIITTTEEEDFDPVMYFGTLKKVCEMVKEDGIVGGKDHNSGYSLFVDDDYLASIDDMNVPRTKNKQSVNYVRYYYDREGNIMKSVSKNSVVQINKNMKGAEGLECVVTATVGDTENITETTFAADEYNLFGALQVKEFKSNIKIVKDINNDKNSIEYVSMRFKYNDKEFNALTKVTLGYDGMREFFSKISRGAYNGIDEHGYDDLYVTMRPSALYTEFFEIEVKLCHHKKTSNGKVKYKENETLFSFNDFKVSGRIANNLSHFIWSKDVLNKKCLNSLCYIYSKICDYISFATIDRKRSGILLSTTHYVNTKDIKAHVKTKANAYEVEYARIECKYSDAITLTLQYRPLCCNGLALDVCISNYFDDDCEEINIDDLREYVKGILKDTKWDKYIDDLSSIPKVDDFDNLEIHIGNISATEEKNGIKCEIHSVSENYMHVITTVGDDSINFGTNIMDLFNGYRNYYVCADFKDGNYSFNGSMYMEEYGDDVPVLESLTSKVPTEEMGMKKENVQKWINTVIKLMRSK